MDKQSPSIKFRWFTEGFVEFFTDVFLFRAGRRSLGDMIEAYNETQLALVHPHDPVASLDAMAAEKSWRLYRPLPYLRGYLLAYELAARLREGGRETLEQRVLPSDTAPPAPSPGRAVGTGYRRVRCRPNQGSIRRELGQRSDADAPARAVVAPIRLAFRLRQRKLHSNCSYFFQLDNEITRS